MVKKKDQIFSMILHEQQLHMQDWELIWTFLFLI